MGYFEGQYHADEVKAIRLKLKMTQKRFGSFLGVGRDLVAQWETGRAKVSPKHTERIKELAHGGLGQTPIEKLAIQRVRWLAGNLEWVDGPLMGRWNVNGLHEIESAVRLIREQPGLHPMPEAWQKELQEKIEKIPPAKRRLV